jgi:dinuclear metal center YbgI/SA1388 family protein
MEEIQSILLWLQEIAPESTALPGDPVGLLVSPGVKNVSTIGVCLDARPRIIEQAAKDGVSLIVSHHPLIYKPLKRIDLNDPIGAAASLLIINKIALYAVHTNWDCAAGGIGDSLAAKIGLKNVQPINNDGESKFLRIGQLPLTITLSTLAQRIKDALGGEDTEAALRFNSDFADRTVQQIAVCGGAGGSLINEAITAKADAYITADVRWDQFVDADSRGFPVLDAGHGATESPGMEALASRLQSRFPNLNILFYH